MRCDLMFVSYRTVRMWRGWLTGWVHKQRLRGAALYIYCSSLGYIVPDLHPI